MLNLNRSNFQAHPFHLVSPSPWPLYTSVSLLSLTTFAGLSLNGFVYAEYNLFLSLTALILSMSFWFRDIIAEGHNTLIVQKGLDFGVVLNLVVMTLPFFNLSCIMNDDINPLYFVLPEQEYLRNEYPDFLKSEGDFVEFDCYLVPESDLEHGALRMLKDGPLRVLEVYNRVILPEIQKILCVFEPIKCCSSSSAAQAFEGLDTIVKPRISELTSIVDHPAPDLDFTSIHSKLAELKANIASMNDIRIHNLEKSIQDNLARLNSIGQDVSEGHGRDYIKFFMYFSELSKVHEFESLRPVMNKVVELSSLTIDKPEIELLESDPIKYWSKKIKFANMDHNNSNHIYKLFKEYIKHNSIFSKEDKTTLFTAIKQMQNTGTKIASTDKLIFNENIHSSRILAELKDLRNK